MRVDATEVRSYPLICRSAGQRPPWHSFCMDGITISAGGLGTAATTANGAVSDLALTLAGDAVLAVAALGASGAFAAPGVAGRYASAQSLTRAAADLCATAATGIRDAITAVESGFAATDRELAEAVR
jgi:hypothetical protein